MRRDFILPKNKAELVSAAGLEEVRRAVEFVNSLQKLSLLIHSSGQHYRLPLLVSRTEAILKGDAPLGDLTRALLVGGGGGAACGGGGGGEVLDFEFTLTAGTYAIEIGAGGAGAVVSTSGVKGTSGGASRAFGRTARGGGGAGNTGDNGQQTGLVAGGGGGAWAAGTTLGGAGPYPGGGNGGIVSSPYPAGGGAGGGRAGGNATAFDAPGIGGDGYLSDISGRSRRYAGGGGACTFSNGLVFAVGGEGGGGTGGNLGSNGENGLGGGGGGRSTGNPGWAGGSGVFILRYSGAPRGTGGTITSVDGDTVHTFTSSGTLSITS